MYFLPAATPSPILSSTVHLFYLHSLGSPMSSLANMPLHSLWPRMRSYLVATLPISCLSSRATCRKKPCLTLPSPLFGCLLGLLLSPVLIFVKPLFTLEKSLIYLPTLLHNLCLHLQGLGQHLTYSRFSGNESTLTETCYLE